MVAERKPSETTEQFTAAAAADYLPQMIREIRNIAGRAGFVTLTYLLDLAALEAEMTRQRLEATVSDPRSESPADA
jgi:hypothetical protein